MKKDPAPSLWLQAGLLTTIPFALLVGPVLGYYLGSWADQRWETSPWGMGVGIVFGLAAGARSTIKLINRAAEYNKKNK